MQDEHFAEQLTTGAAFRRMGVRDVLLGIQVAICALLLTASLVALRGMEGSLNAPLGFQPSGVLLAKTDMHMAGYTEDSSLRIQRRMLEEVAGIPGVAAVGTIDEPPLGTGGSSTPVYREDTTDFRNTKCGGGEVLFHLGGLSPGSRDPIASGPRVYLARRRGCSKDCVGQRTSPVRCLGTAWLWDAVSSTPMDLCAR